MGVKKKYDQAVPVQLTTLWFDRVKAVADHERIEVSMSQVIRDCIELALPGFELELGLVELDDLDEETLEALGVSRAPEPAPPVKEDRAAGSFGWTAPNRLDAVLINGLPLLNS